MCKGGGEKEECAHKYERVTAEGILKACERVRVRSGRGGVCGCKAVSRTFCRRFLGNCVSTSSFNRRTMTCLGGSGEVAA